MSSYVPTKRRDLLKWLDELKQEGRRDQQNRIEEWDKASEIVNGKQWLDKGSPFFLANLIAPSLERKQALLTECKPTIQILPRRIGLDATSKVLTRTIHAGWDQNGMGAADAELELYRSRFGCAYVSIEYDPAASFGMGDIVVNVWDPRQIQIDPVVRKTRDLDSAQYIIASTVEPVYELKARYPDAADLVPDKGNARLEYDSERGRLKFRIRDGTKDTIKGAIESANEKRGGGGQHTAIPRCDVEHYWFVDPRRDRGGDLMYPNGRHLIRVEDQILNWSEDDPESGVNPYYDGRWPFEMLDAHTDPDSPVGRSDVLNLRRVQEAFNRLGHLTVRTSLDNGRPVILTDPNALDANMVNQLRDAGWIIIEKNITGRMVERTPAGVPDAVRIQLMEMCRMLVNEISGLSDATAGKGRIELRSGDQFDAIQQQGQILLRADARKKEQFYERLGSKWISRIFQFYTADRIMTFVTDQGKAKQFTMEVQQLRKEIEEFALKNLVQEARLKSVMDGAPPELPDEEERATAILNEIKGAWRQFMFHIKPLSSLQSARMQRAMTKRQLAMDGYYPYSDILSEELDIDNAEEKMQQAAKEMATRQMMGLGPPQQPKKGGKKA